MLPFKPIHLLLYFLNPFDPSREWNRLLKKIWMQFFPSSAQKSIKILKTILKLPKRTKMGL